MASALDTRNFTRGPLPTFPFAEALQATLPNWDMSLVFAGTTRAQQMNIALRKKDYVPNVLSYEVGTGKKGARRSGEIVICPQVAKKQAPEYGLSYKEFVGLLFIHGCLHLKGMQHGATMDRHERLVLKRFIPKLSKPSNVPTHRNRH